MDDIIVFLMGSALCFGVWYAIARLDQWQGDQQLRKKYGKKQGD